jgi:hypothetical protein
MGYGAAIGIGLGLLSTYMASKEKKESGKDVARATKKAAAWNAKLSLYDAAVMEDQARQIQYRTGIELQLHASMIDRILGSQKATYGASGVTGGTGSALDVAAATAAAGAQDADTIRYEGNKAAKYAVKMADRYRLLAEGGLREAAAYASAIIDTSRAQANAMLISGGAKFAGDIYGIGSQEGWWD